MNPSAPKIGFDRYVDLDWCRASFDVATEVNSPEHLWGLVAETLPGKESQRKTIDILKRISTKPFPALSNFIDRGLKIYKQAGRSAVLPLAWGGALASYPFFGKTSESIGRLLSLQGDCSIKELQRRMAETYGERNGIERAVTRVLQSQVGWSVLERDDAAKRILKRSPTIIDDDELTLWLIEAAVRYAAKPVAITSLQSLPVLFPFTLARPLAYLASKSPNLVLHSEGHSNQFVSVGGDI